MTEKHGFCERCGKHGLVADYGPDGEFICIPCGSTSQEEANRVLTEMTKRHGADFVSKGFAKAQRRGRTIH